MWFWDRDIPLRYVLTDGFESDDDLFALCANAEGLFHDPAPGVRERFQLTITSPSRDLLGKHPAWLGDNYLTSGHEYWNSFHAVAVDQLSLVDCVIEGVLDLSPDGDEPSFPPEKSLQLFDCDDTFLGDVHASKGIFKLRPDPVHPLRLNGCDLFGAFDEHVKMGKTLRAATLHILNEDGEPWRHQYVNIRNAKAVASKLGRGLVDVKIPSGMWHPPATAAEQVWELWHRGGPTVSGLWTALNSTGRKEWAAAALSGRPARYDKEIGRTYVLEGRYVTDFPGFLCSLGEAINGPGGYFGSNLDALHDCFKGGFGALAPFTLTWRDSVVAREHLTGSLAPKTYGPPAFDEIVRFLKEHRVTVELA